ncbi:MAG: peptidylprolyl isomerase [Nitrososphaerales archaeon]
MPHTSKKYKKSATAKGSSNRMTYIVIAVVVIIIVAAASFYAYSTFLSTTTHIATTTSLGGNTTGQYYAVINTTQGVMEAQMFHSVAPKTVINFVNLANSGFYNNLVWHRIVKGFVIQTGDPNTKNGGGNPANWGQGGSGTTVPLETNSTVVSEGYVNNEGYLAMARGSDPNSGSSQFFINLADNSALNGQYTVFGKIISGMNVALAIGNLPVSTQCQSSGQLQCTPTNPSQAMVISITIKDSP